MRFIHPTHATIFETVGEVVGLMHAKKAPASLKSYGANDQLKSYMNRIALQFHVEVYDPNGDGSFAFVARAPCSSAGASPILIQFQIHLWARTPQAWTYHFCTKLCCFQSCACDVIVTLDEVACVVNSLVAYRLHHSCI